VELVLCCDLRPPVPPLILGFNDESGSVDLVVIIIIVICLRLPHCSTIG